MHQLNCNKKARQQASYAANLRKSAMWHQNMKVCRTLRHICAVCQHNSTNLSVAHAARINQTMAYCNSQCLLTLPETVADIIKDQALRYCQQALQQCQRYALLLHKVLLLTVTQFVTSVTSQDGLNIPSNSRLATAATSVAPEPARPHWLASCEPSCVLSRSSRSCFCSINSAGHLNIGRHSLQGNKVHSVQQVNNR